MPAGKNNRQKRDEEKRFYTDALATIDKKGNRGI